MSNLIADRVQETTATTGTGTLTLAGASTAFRTFSSALSNSDTCDYCLLGGNGTDWETGIGTYSSGTLTRDTVYASSNSGSKISLTGTSTVFITVTANKIASLTPNTDITCTFDGSETTVAGISNSYPGSAAAVSSLSDGDCYYFQAVFKKTTSDTGAALIFSANKTSGHGIMVQLNTNGTASVETDTTNVVSTSTSAVGNLTGWICISGTLTISTGSTFICVNGWGVAAACTSGVTLAGGNLWVGIRLFSGSGTIGKVILRKLAP